MRSQFLSVIDRFQASPWLQAVLLLIAGLALAQLLGLVLQRLLPRLTRRTRTEVDDAVLAAVRLPVMVSVLAIAGNLALLRILDLDGMATTDWPTSYRLALGLLKTIVVVAWLGFGLKLSSIVLGALSRHHHRVSLVSPKTLPLIDNVAKVAVVAVAVYFLLLAWGADVTGWMASAGIAGLVVGLAAKDTLANLFAGLALLTDTPFHVGDFIVLESGVRGEVTDIGIRSSRIQTRDDIEVIVPNSILANSMIVNEAGGPARHHRVRVKVAVAYGSDIGRVREVLLEIATDHPLVLAEPAPRVRFRTFGDSGLDFELLGWIAEPVLRGRVIDALNTAVYERFGVEEIEIPFPQMDLHLRTTAPHTSEETSGHDAE